MSPAPPRVRRYNAAAVSRTADDCGPVRSFETPYSSSTSGEGASALSASKLRSAAWKPSKSAGGYRWMERKSSAALAGSADQKRELYPTVIRWVVSTARIAFICTERYAARVRLARLKNVVQYGVAGTDG